MLCLLPQVAVAGQQPNNNRSTTTQDSRQVTDREKTDTKVSADPQACGGVNKCPQPSQVETLKASFMQCMEAHPADPNAAAHWDLKGIYHPR
jgi:hypothetical protein